MTDTRSENIMVDIETTGLDPLGSRMTSIALVPFKIVDGFIIGLSERAATSYHKRIECDYALRGYQLSYPDTLVFREKHGVDSQEAKLPSVRLHDFNDDVREYLGNLGYEYDTTLFWSKPSTFDFPYISTMLNYVHHKPFWHYRNLVDLRSYIMGMGVDHARILAMEKKLPFAGTPHVALDDCIHQLNVLDYFMMNYGMTWPIETEAEQSNKAGVTAGCPHVWKQIDDSEGKPHGRQCTKCGWAELDMYS